MSRKNIVYYGSWSHNNKYNNLPIDQIDPSIATHFVYAFFNVDIDARITCEDENLVHKFIALKNRNHNAKFILSVGGWNAGTHNFSAIASSSSGRSKLARNALDACIKYGFDGFDMDWEYSKANDRDNFSALCQELGNILKSGGKTFSVAAAASPCGEHSYDVPRIQQYVDFIMVMAYDFYGSWSNNTGIHCGMYGGSSKQTNVNDCVNAWINAGLPSHKLILGLPTYGNTFTLANSSNNGVGAVVSGPGNPPTLTYKQISHKINHEGWHKVWEGGQQAPYAYSGNQWVGFDDERSIGIKLDFIKNNHLGGAMWWSIDGDDNRFPLIRMAQNRLT